ncbi:hypothetical protein E2C01_012961 [Portunus trituberculatus]|uniref:Uncharacterized protein n=1 Tax=Portunus trituberculatus TaxID=210409 RepID=A0A5B7DF22_PORTR|nr:hypothetical protein [Portunus trituberculatus]
MWRERVMWSQHPPRATPRAAGSATALSHHQYTTNSLSCGLCPHHGPSRTMFSSVMSLHNGGLGGGGSGGRELPAHKLQQHLPPFSSSLPSRPTTPTHRSFTGDGAT